MFKITIPKPCHEDWAQMSASDQGRHCNVCAKTVTDFTSMTDEEVQNYLVNKTKENICGRFTTVQLQRVRVDIPQKVFYLSMPTWKKFLVASLLVFGSTLFSCDTGIERSSKGDLTGITTGKFAKTSCSPDIIKDMQQLIDTPRCTPTVGTMIAIKQTPDRSEMGKVAIRPDTSKPVIVKPQQITMGMVAVPQKKVKQRPKQKDQ